MHRTHSICGARSPLARTQLERFMFGIDICSEEQIIGCCIASSPALYVHSGGEIHSQEKANESPQISFQRSCWSRISRSSPLRTTTVEPQKLPRKIRHYAGCSRRHWHFAGIGTRCRTQNSRAQQHHGCHTASHSRRPATSRP